MFAIGGFEFERDGTVNLRGLEDEKYAKVSKGAGVWLEVDIDPQVNPEQYDEWQIACQAWRTMARAGRKSYELRKHEWEWLHGRQWANRERSHTDINQREVGPLYDELHRMAAASRQVADSLATMPADEAPRHAFFMRRNAKETRAAQADIQNTVPVLAAELILDAALHEVMAEQLLETTDASIHELEEAWGEAWGRWHSQGGDTI